MVDGLSKREVIVIMDKRGEYKIKEKHIIKLSKLYEEVKQEKETKDKKEDKK